MSEAPEQPQILRDISADWKHRDDAPQDKKGSTSKATAVAAASAKSPRKAAQKTAASEG